MHPFGQVFLATLAHGHVKNFMNSGSSYELALLVGAALLELDTHDGDRFQHLAHVIVDHACD